LTLKNLNAIMVEKSKILNLRILFHQEE